MRFTLPIIALFCLIQMGCSSCQTGNSGQQDSTPDEKLISVAPPDFVADTAYQYIEKQLAFGYRIPGTPAHKLCADWLYQALKMYCDTVYFQKGSAVTFDKKTIPVYNLIGSFNPGKIQRAMLASHWDSRPWGDNDTANTDKPILAANDGASGVAVLLEMARQMKKSRPKYGVDIVFFDAEDYGKSGYDNSFCLGSQYWGKNLHRPGYRAQFGVLLDMVGGKNAQFWKENFSAEKAGWVQNHLWNIGAELGYADFFQQGAWGPIIDDHVYVNQATGIPMVDIIQHDPQEDGFAYYWHTHADDMKSIDKNTLKAVGQTLTAFIFNPPVTINP